jgi:hypothetical protein
MNRIADMVKGPQLKALGEAIIFLVRDVQACPIPRLPSAMQTAGVVQSGIDRWMFIQILTVVNGCPLLFRQLRHRWRELLPSPHDAIRRHRGRRDGPERRGGPSESVKICRMVALREGSA